MSKAPLQLTYAGPEVKFGVMDAQDLGTALISVGALCRQASLSLNGRDVTVHVRVKADFKKGSFGVHFEIQTILAMTGTLLTTEHFRAAASAAGLIRNIFGSGGLIDLLKRLRGNKDPKISTLPDGRVKINVDGDHNHIVVNQNIFALANDPAARKAVAAAVRPLSKKGVNSLAVKSGLKVLQTVKKNEVEYLSSNVPEDPLTPAEKDTDSGVTRLAYLNIVKLSFKQRNKWSFSDGSGGNLVAQIEDQAFIDRIDRHEYSFGKGDQLKVYLRTRNIKQPGGKYQAEHTIVKVLDLIRSPQTDMTEMFDRT